MQHRDRARTAAVIIGAGIIVGSLWIAYDVLDSRIAQLELRDALPLPSRAHHVAIQDLTAAIEGASDELEPLLADLERQNRMRAQARTRM